MLFCYSTLTSLYFGWMVIPPSLLRANFQGMHIRSKEEGLLKVFQMSNFMGIGSQGVEEDEDSAKQE